MNVSGALQLLISFALDFYIVIVITRFMLQMVRADFYNPLSQFVVKATSPLLNPLRRIIPGYGGWDMASVALLVVVVLLKVILVLVINGYPLEPLVVGVLGVRSLGKALIDYFSLAIFAGAILSWFAQGYHPVVHVIMQVSEPVLRPFRKLIPSMGGLDLSPFFALLALQILKTLFGLDGVP
jgi:YggT family protein